MMGERIRARRLARGLTGTELAAASGLSESYVSLIEGGKREPRLATLRAIAGALGTTVEWLTAGGGEPEVPSELEPELLQILRELGPVRRQALVRWLRDRPSLPGPAWSSRRAVRGTLEGYITRRARAA